MKRSRVKCNHSGERKACQHCPHNGEHDTYHGLCVAGLEEPCYEEGSGKALFVKCEKIEVKA